MKSGSLRTLEGTGPCKMDRTPRAPEVFRTCRICGDRGSAKIYTAGEMLTGTREQFSYFECSWCGCLQIDGIPRDLGKYYPAGYYSLQEPRRVAEHGLLRSFLRKRRDAYLLYREGIDGKLLQALRPADLPYEILGRVPRIRIMSILDVGCGSGMFLKRLKELGMDQVMGVDPFIKDTLDYGNGLKVIKGTIQELALRSDRHYDIILFNHSFEHMADPDDVLQAAAGLLNDGGRIIMHVPLSDSYAWKHYGTNWVQLDPPRHLYLYSRESLRILSERAGFTIDDIVYTSKAFQFWGSELYARNIAMSQHGIPEELFSRSEMRRYKAEALVLNAKQQGDQAAFYLRRTADRM